MSTRSLRCGRIVVTTPLLLLAVGCGGGVSEDGIAARAAVAEVMGSAQEAGDGDQRPAVDDGCPVVEAATFAEIQEELGDAEVSQLQSMVEQAELGLPTRAACAFDLDDLEGDSRRVFVWVGDLGTDQDLATFLSEAPELAEVNVVQDGEQAAGCAPPEEEAFCIAMTVNQGFIIAAGTAGPGTDEPGARATLERFQPAVYQALLG
jgi:hypothetical protein